MISAQQSGSEISFQIDPANKTQFFVEQLDSGQFVLAWEDRSIRPAPGGIQLFDSTGVAITAPVLSNEPDYAYADQTIFGRGDGSFIDFKVSLTSSLHPTLFIGIYDANGQLVLTSGTDSPSHITAYNAGPLEVVELSNGKYVASYQHYTEEGAIEGRPADYDLGALIYSSDGVAVGSVALAADYFVVESALDISPLAAGGLMAIWHEAVSFEDSTGNIRAQVFGANGQSLVGPFLVVADPAGTIDEANLATLDDGRVAAVWSDDASPSSLFVRLYDQGGNALGAAAQVQVDHAGSFTGIDAIAVNNGFAVIWEASDGNSDGIWAQLFDIDGAKAGEAFLVNSDIAGDQGLFRADRTADGFVVSWQTGGYGLATDVAAQLFTIANDNVIHGDGVINGTELADQIIGGAGPDTISGFGGDDPWLFGDGGSDQIHGGAGNDIIGGGDGSDGNLSGDEGSDTVYGGDGNDSIFGGAGDDGWLTGDAGSDQINGEAGNDTLSGGDGDDSFLSGDAGNDEIYGGAGNDTISGGDDDDHWLSGGAGDDEIYGGAGNDVIDGGDGDDHFLSGQAGADEVYGGAGNDTISGDDGADFLAGGVGDDRISGGNDADMIAGDGGNDSLAGEGGNDTISGGGGSDFLVGGEGADRFAFATGDLATTADAAAFILDFSAGEGDVIDLLGVEAKTGDKFAPFIFIGAAAFSHQAGELQVTDQGGFHLVSGDTDGDGQGDFFLKVSSATAPTRADFDANEYIPGTEGDDPWLFGGRGSDQIYGLGGNDVIGGGDGDDRYLSGGNGTDQVYGGDGNDIISGDDGNDPWLSGQAGDDTISGGDGNDMLSGDDGDDVLAGSAGNDEIYGGEGDDYLLGEGGTNTLLGGAGNDTLKSEQGDNLMYGGTGADVFSFQDLTTADVPTYTIGDFSRAEGDRIQLFGIDAIKGLPHDAFTFIGSDVFTGQAGQLRYSAESGHFVLSGDITGDGVGDFFINLYSTTAPEIGDFLL